jgi:hypothetical protein
VYRRGASGVVKVNSAPVSGTSFVDNTRSTGTDVLLRDQRGECERNREYVLERGSSRHPVALDFTKSGSYLYRTKNHGWRINCELVVIGARPRQTQHRDLALDSEMSETAKRTKCFRSWRRWIVVHRWR